MRLTHLVICYSLFCVQYSFFFRNGNGGMDCFVRNHSHKKFTAPTHRDVPRGVYDEAIPSKSSIALKITIHFNFLSIIDSFIVMRIYKSTYFILFLLRGLPLLTLRDRNDIFMLRHGSTQKDEELLFISHLSLSLINL